jgi:hypothetical protein
MFMKRRPQATIIRRRRRRKCGIVDFFTKVKIFKRSIPDGIDWAALTTTAAADESEARGGGDTSCEIHIDGDYLFVAIALLGAGLAYITYTTITAGRRRRKKKRSTATAAGKPALDILIGIYTHKSAKLLLKKRLLGN